MKNATHVYVAGPMSKGNLLSHIRSAIQAGSALLEAGYIPFLPQLCAQWEIVAPRPYEDWMLFDFAWLERCDALVRLPGESAGADREVARALELGLPVYTLDELLRAPSA